MIAMFIVTMFWLIVAHILFDYALQGDFMSKAKNRYDPIPGVPAWLVLGSHGLLQGGAVAFVTNSLALGLVEMALHVVIDDTKCARKITFAQDQMLHVLCKVAIAIIGVYAHPGF